MAINRVEAGKLLEETHPWEGREMIRFEGVDGSGSPFPSANSFPESIRGSESPKSPTSNGEGEYGIYRQQQDNCQ